MKPLIKRVLLLLLMTVLISGIGYSMTDIETYAGDNRTILAFTSDVHNNAKSGVENRNAGANRLQTWITNEKQAYNEIDYMGFCGDLGATGNVTETEYWTNVQSVINVADVEFPNKVCYTTGNHELENGHYPSEHVNYTGTSNALKDKFTVDAIPSDVPSNCQIYCMGSQTYQNSNNNNVNSYLDIQVTKLESFLSGCDASKPVFILSHYPLHYFKKNIYTAGRYTINADNIIDVLNTAANKNLMIVFLWGHNHTNSDTYYDHIYKPNDSLQYDENSTHKKTIKFVYAAAGCMSDQEYSDGSASVKGKGLIVEVMSNKAMSFTYYDANGDPVTTAEVAPPAPTYTVQFNANGHGTAPSSQTVTSGNKLTRPTDPVADDYIFGGWFKESACNNEWNFDTDTVTGNTTLYAKWTADTTVYSISYNLDGGSLEAGKSNPTQYKKTSADFTLNNPVKQHYTFAGWTGTGLTKATNTVTIKRGSTGTRSYTATWTPDTYYVSFNKNDSRATGSMSAQKYTYGTAQKLTKNGFTKPCYNFVEWNTKADSTGTSYADQASITVSAGMTLYAQWAEGTHNWSFKGFTWTGNTSNGYTAASANYVCLKDSTHAKAVQATITSKVTEPTCTENGKTTYTAAITASASPDNSAHTDSKDAEIIQATGHSVSGAPWQHNDNQHWHTCTVCNQEVDKSAHSWNAGVVTTEPTTDQAGEKTYTCTACGVTKTEAINPTGSGTGGGGGTPSSGGGDAPTDTQPPQSEPSTVSDPNSPVAVSAVVEDNTATISPISKEALAEVKSDDVISLDLSGMAGKEVTSLCIPTDTMKNIAESPAKGVEIKLDTATVNLNQQMMESLALQAKGNEIKLQIDSGSKAEPTLNNRQKETVSEMNDPVVVEANLTSGSEKISQFNGGIMTLSFQYVTNDFARGWFLPDSGSKEPVPCSYSDHVATLSLSHCSHYAVEGYVPIKNQLTVKACTSKKKPVAVKARKVKKAARKIPSKKYVSVRDPKGDVSYEKISGKAAFSVNAKSGSIIVKKGTKKGTYKLKIKVTAAGDNTFQEGSKNVTCYVKVK